MDDALMRHRVEGARVGRLASINADGRPHLVPCCYAVDGDALYTAVDDVKQKSTLRLRRLDNIRLHPSVAFLIDHYAEDWSALWWIRADGPAQLAEPGSRAHATGLELLTAKYEQYRRQPPPGPVIAVAVDTWRAWP